MKPNHIATWAVLFLLHSGRVFAQCAETKLTALDAASGDYFGASVAIDGDVAVVGAPDHDSAGANAGAAYVFRRNGGIWVEEQKLVASDAAPGDRLGTRVSIGGSVIVLGLPEEDNAFMDNGSVYVFRYSGSTWNQEQKLIPNDPYLRQRFGWSVAVDDNVIAASTYDDFFAGGSERGAVYLFRWNGAAWVQEQKLLASDAANLDHFGFRIALDEGVLVATSQKGPNGAAYSYRWNGSQWAGEQIMLPWNTTTLMDFGQTVGLFDDLLVVGAPRDDQGGTNAGAVYVFRKTGSSWQADDKLLSPTAFSDYNFGNLLAVGEDRILANEFHQSEGIQGISHGHLVRRNLSSWIPASEIISDDVSGYFGFESAALSGDNLILGAPTDDQAAPDAGAVYLYDITVCLGVVPALGTNGLLVLG